MARRFEILALAAACLVLASCGTNPYGAYRAAHPGWDGAFPTEEADLWRTVASLHAPPRGRATVVVTDVFVWRIESPSWRPVDVSAQRAGLGPADAEGSYAVFALFTCSSSDGEARFAGGSWAWYLLPDDRLAAWDHADFLSACLLSSSFRPARGELIEAERQLLERVGFDPDAQFMTANRAYDRGLAYVEAGRLEDARAMLDRGAGSPTTQWSADANLRYGRESRHLDAVSEEDVIAKREALVRAISGRAAEEDARPRD